MKDLTTSRRRCQRAGALLVAVASAVSGCAANEPAGDVEGSPSAIIGGGPISVATRRALGLVVASGLLDCSGSLLGHDWVLTATHCMDFSGGATANRFVLPKANGVLEMRFGIAAETVGPTDLAIAQLAPPDPGSEWPDVANTMYSGNPAALVGQSVTCFGRGDTAYVSPSGLTGAGIWRGLIKPVSSFANDLLTLTATSAGTEIPSPGDSGGPCIANSQIAGVASFGNVECADHSNCARTVTKVLDANYRSTTAYKAYIDHVVNRIGGAATFQPLVLAAGWNAHPFATNDPGAALIDNTVHLRGAIATAGTDAVAFTLPSRFRPSAEVYVPTNLCHATKGRLHITPAGTVDVQPEGGSWSNAQCFTSLDGVSFAVDSGAATLLTLINGWSNAPYGTRSAAARVTNGIVRLQGAISGGSTAQAFTLPAGFRPTASVYVAADLCNATKGRLVIQPDGAVTITAFGGALANAQCFTSLEGVSFDAGGGDFFAGLQNGWTTSGFNTRSPTFRNVGGIVRLSGAMATTGTDGVAFRLPANFAPATNVYVPVDLCNAEKGRLIIQPDGIVFVQTAGAFGDAQCFTSLDGAWFGL